MNSIEFVVFSFFNFFLTIIYNHLIMAISNSWQPPFSPEISAIDDYLMKLKNHLKFWENSKLILSHIHFPKGEVALV